MNTAIAGRLIEATLIMLGFAAAIILAALRTAPPF